MTILQVKNQLISHFFSNDTFEFEKHQLMVEFEKDVASFRAEMLKAALTELEQVGVVKKMAIEGREMWVLTQSMHSFNQQVVISPICAELIANTVNAVNEIQNIDVECDKTKIDEQDLMRLVQIVEDMLEDDDDEGDE